MPQRIGFTVPLRRVWLWSLLMGGYACLTPLSDLPPFSELPDIPRGLDAAATLAMGMLLVFRTNRAYERWWEARIHWGTLVNVSRNLAVKVRQLVRPNEEEIERTYQLIVANSYALMDHLRDDFKLDTVAQIATTDELAAGLPQHEPSFVVSKIYALLQNWREQKAINGYTLWLLDQELRVFLEVCGACERIKSTLMSQSWRAFTRQCIVVYLLVIPWGLYEGYGVWTIPLTIVVSYFVIGGEGIAHYVEEPFGHHEDHLDLHAICRAIDTSVAEILKPQRKAM